MSRSYRHQPFIAIIGGGKSAKEDKVLAHRGERRTQNRALYAAFKANDFEDFLIPHMYECPWNEVYSWRRDGNQQYCGPNDFWAKYDPDWYLKMMRK
jgi:hypothetical protein